MSLTYVITGASRGLGLEFVKQISAKGHTVFALARNPEACEGLKSLVDNKKVFAIKIDANSEESAKEAAKEVEKNAPNGINVLINNAGISGSGLEHTTENTPKEEYMNVFETNVAGVSNVTEAFLPLLRKSGEDKTKKILNMSSIIGSIAVIASINPGSQASAYAVSKAALNMLTKMTATLLAKENFIVYASHPGWVKTDMGGENAPIEPVDSIAGMLNVIDNLTPEQNGAFLDFQGKEVAW